MSDGPLSGYRVLDLSRFGPGLLSGMVLEDLGADVIRVDEPTSSPTGLASRSVGLDRTHPAYALNRGKRSIAIDLKSADGLAIFIRLVATADVVIEGFRPGVTTRLGIDYASLAARNAKLVYCSITGYGQTGPLRDVPGHDLNYAAAAGLLSLTGFADRRQPAVLGIPFADFAGGSLPGVIAILAALLARVQTGRGQYLDIAITDGALLMLALQYSRYQIERNVPQLGTDRLNGGMPYHNLYEAADGRYVAVAASEPRFWRNLCAALEVPDLTDQQFAEGDMRAAVFDRLRTRFLERTRDQWMQLLLDKDSCVSPVLALDELASDPHIQARQMIVERPGPTGAPVLHVGVGLRFSDTPAVPGGAPATWGQHTGAILAELGLSEQEVAFLRSSGAIE